MTEALRFLWDTAPAPVVPVGIHLLSLARAQKVDLAGIALSALLDQLAAALRQAPAAASLSQKGDWVVMAAWLVQLRSRLLLPVEAPARQDATARKPASCGTAWWSCSRHRRLRCGWRAGHSWAVTCSPAAGLRCSGCRSRPHPGGRFECVANPIAVTWSVATAPTRSAGPPNCSTDPHRSRGIDQNNFRILDSDDLHRAQVGNRRTIPRLNANIPDIDDARGWNQIGVPLGV